MHGGDDRLAPQVWLWGAFLWALLLALAFSPYSRAEAIKEILRWSEAFLIWLMALALARRPDLYLLCGTEVPHTSAVAVCSAYSAIGLLCMATS